MNRLPLAYFDGHKTGDILSRVTSDIESVSNFLTQSFAPTITGLLQILFSIGMILFIRPQIIVIIVVMMATMGSTDLERTSKCFRKSIRFISRTFKWIYRNESLQSRRRITTTI